MKKQKKFRKVVEWGQVEGDDKTLLVLFILMLIPIVNIIVFLVILSFMLKDREVYWEKI